MTQSKALASLGSRVGGWPTGCEKGTVTSDDVFRQMLEREEAREARVAAARERGDFEAIIRDERDEVAFEELEKHAHELSPEVFSTLLGERYRNGDRPMQWPVVARLFRHPSLRRELLMTPEDRSKLAALPPEFEVWRGDKAHFDLGLSWTRCRTRAEEFAGRHAHAGGEPRLTKAICSKADVIAYFPSHGEEEVLVEPERLRDTECEPFTP